LRFFLLAILGSSGSFLIRGLLGACPHTPGIFRFGPVA
jgi:small ligand-binding sensory domain FIST